MVNPKDFVGRKELVKDILKYIPAIINGKNRNFYITGNRGMGKSSLSYYISYILENEFDILPIYISNEGINDLNSLIYHLIQNLLDKIGNKNWAEKIIQSFGENIEEVGFMSTRFKFKDKSGDYIQSVIDSFEIFIKKFQTILGNIRV